MARQFIPIENLASEGLREDTGSVQKLWTKLDNVRRASTGWKARPGTSKLGGSLPTTVEPGLPKLIVNFKNPPSAPLSEALTPSAVGEFGEWTASSGETLVTAIDEESPNTANYIFATGLGNKVSYTFTSLGGTWNTVDFIRFRLQVARHATVSHDLKVFLRISGVLYDLATVFVEAGTGHQLVTVDSTTNPDTGESWTPDEVDLLEVVLEKGVGRSGTLVQYQPIGGALLFQAISVPAFTATFGDGDLDNPDGDGGGYFIGDELGNTSSGETGLLKETGPADPRFPEDADFVGQPTKILVKVQIRGFEGSFGTDFGFSGIVVRLSEGLNLTSGSTKLTTVIQSATLKSLGVDTTYKTLEFLSQEMTYPDEPFVITMTIFDSSGGPTVRVSSVQVFRDGSTTDDTQQLRVTWLRPTVVGQGTVAVNNVLLLGTSKAVMSVSEDLTTYSDITGGVTITAPESHFWDSVIFKDKLYITNGTDQIIFMAVAGTLDQQSGNPTGRCLGAFAKRLWLGDVTDAGTRFPSQLSWSKIDDPEDWIDASAGDLQLDETGGSVLRIKNLVERSQSLIGVMVAYKTEGIYHIIATGDANDPFAKKLMDGTTGLLAPGTLQGVSFRDGRERHVFLGRIGGPGGSLNVMSWDGAQTELFGFEIIPLLEELADQVNLSQSVAGLDSFGNYIIVFPPVGSAVPSQAVVYNFAHKTWTRWSPGSITAVGRWVPSVGAPITAIGRPDSFAYELTEAVVTDDLVSAVGVDIPITLETGDLSLGNSWEERTLERVWLYYVEGKSFSNLGVSVSTDGGETFRSSEQITNPDFQAISSGESTRLQQFDTRATGRKHRVRITSSAAAGQAQLLQLILEAQSQGHRYTSDSETD